MKTRTCSLLPKTAALFALSVFTIFSNLPASGQQPGTPTLEQLIAGGFLPSVALVWVGDTPPATAESQDLWNSLQILHAMPWPQGLPILEEFITNYPSSPWVPSLRSQLAEAYHEAGRDTLALEHWEAAWTATADMPSGHGKAVADYTLANWTRLLASLGRYEGLVPLVLQNQNRVLDMGPLSQKWVRTREAVEWMRVFPGMSYKCGTFAMDQVARALGLSYSRSALLGVPSPDTGFSMQTLANLSSRLGLGLVPVYRQSGMQLPVPAVVHWNLNHYGAIISQVGQFYKVVDPTFGVPRYMTADTINAEASGAFLIPASGMLAGFVYLSPAQTSQIFGRGNPDWINDNDDQQCCPNPCPPGSRGGGPGSGPGSFAGGGCASCRGVGMPNWSISEPYINLWLEDEPLGYQSGLGPNVSFAVSFKQRQENQMNADNFSNVGNNSFCSWLSAVDARSWSSYGDFHWSWVHLAGGGYAYFPNADGTQTNYYNLIKLTAQTNASGFPHELRSGLPLRCQRGVHLCAHQQLRHGKGAFLLPHAKDFARGLCHEVLL